MNCDYPDIAALLEQLRDEYAEGCDSDLGDRDLPTTERDTVAEIRCRLQTLFRGRDVNVHCEVKPAPSHDAQPDQLKRLPRVDIVLLTDREGASWFKSAKDIQARYRKGSIEARFASVPVEFFHTAIEVKIQSNVCDAKRDIDTLVSIIRSNPRCNGFLVLLNARGRPQDHAAIAAYGQERCIHVVEYTAQT